MVFVRVVFYGACACGLFSMVEAITILLHRRFWSGTADGARFGIDSEHGFNDLGHVHRAGICTFDLRQVYETRYTVQHRCISALTFLQHVRCACSQHHISCISFVAQAAVFPVSACRIRTDTKRPSMKQMRCIVDGSEVLNIGHDTCR